MNKNKTKAELLVELEKAQLRIAELESAAFAQEADDRFLRIFRVSSSPMALSDLTNGKFVDVNDPFIETTGYSRAEIVGKTATELSVFFDAERRMELMQKAMHQGFLRGEHALIRTKTGEQRHGIFAAEFIQIGHQKLLLTMMHDVTDIMQVKDNLQKSEIRYRTLVESLDVSLCRWHPDTTLTYTNEKYRQIFGLQTDGLGHKWLDFLPDESRSDTLSFYADVVRYPRAVTYEHPARVQDGSIHDFQWIDTPILDDAGSLIEFQSVGLDITELKQAENAARESEARLVGILDATPDAMLIVNAQGKILMANQKTSTTFGFSTEELQGATVELLLPQAVQGEHVKKRIKYMADPQYFIAGVGQVIHGQRKDGSQFPAEVSLSYHRMANGETVVLSAVRDISERLQMQEALRASEERYRRLSEELEKRVEQRTAEVQDLYNNAPTGYHSLDVNGKYLEVNQTELNWLGYSRNELLGSPFPNFLTEESVKVFDKAFTRFKKIGKVTNLELEMCRKDGSTFPVLLNADAIQDEAGNFLRSRSTIFDNSERKAAEIALRESEATYRDLFDNTYDALFLIDPNNGLLLRANRRAPMLLGYDSVKDILGKHSSEFILPAQHPDANQRTIEVLLNDRLPPYERTFVQKDGLPIIVEITLSLIKDSNGQPRFIQSTVRDITQRKQAEEAMHRANLEMERAMRMKDEFLASMSHELRTPLTGILGITESLQEGIYGPLIDKQVRAVNSIEASGRHLLDLINDILDVAKLEAGRIELEMATFSLGQVCQSGLQLVRGMAHKKAHHMSFSMQPATIQMYGDSRRIKQVIVNLLSNAVKYTPAGGSIGLEVEGNETNQIIELSVYDTGIGIKPEDIDKLFQPFVQIDSSLARQQTGTGLGLTLVQNLVDLHGGSVRVESEFGKGSRFTVTLPWRFGSGLLPGMGGGAAAQETPVRSAKASAQVQAEQGMVMVVDDNELNTQIIYDFLDSRGFKVITAQDGYQFLNLVDTVCPNVVVMDIQMPGMDGLEAIRLLRKHSNPQVASVPVIAMTALAMPGDRERCIEAGANEYLSKPVRFSQLAEVVEGLFQLHRRNV